MAHCDLTHPAFTCEDAAREHLEGSRWPNGAVCFFCNEQKAVKPLGGKSMGKGWYHCAACCGKFTVRVGTLYERSHAPIHKWLLATHLLTPSKKGMSAYRLHRMLGVTYKTAWFMAHRIRESLCGEGTSVLPIGGEGKVVEADETYFGKQADRGPSTQRKGRPYTRGGTSGPGGKRAVLALVERKGNARLFHMARSGQGDGYEDRPRGCSARYWTARRHPWCSAN